MLLEQLLHLGLATPALLRFDLLAILEEPASARIESADPSERPGKAVIARQRKRCMLEPAAEGHGLEGGHGGYAKGPRHIRGMVHIDFCKAACAFGELLGELGIDGSGSLAGSTPKRVSINYCDL